MNHITRSRHFLWRTHRLEQLKAAITEEGLEEMKEQYKEMKEMHRELSALEERYYQLTGSND